MHVIVAPVCRHNYILLYENIYIIRIPFRYLVQCLDVCVIGVFYMLFEMMIELCYSFFIECLHIFLHLNNEQNNILIFNHIFALGECTSDSGKLLNYVIRMRRYTLELISSHILCLQFWYIILII